MQDRDIALAHLALSDAETADEAVAWRAHWSKYIDDFAVAEHSGDCTKMPWTCSRCLADEAYKMVPVYRELFKI